MSLLFCVRPATRNIGNDVINRATSDLIYQVFGRTVGIANIPALKGPQFGGFTIGQVYDMNRLADGVVLGGGNLFENGQVTVEPQALAALQVPLMLIGLSHGRIYGREGTLVERTDGTPPQIISQLIDKASHSMVRDRATQERLKKLTSRQISLAGCPTMFMSANPPDMIRNGSVLISIRHPNRMNLPPTLQWRVADDLRRLIAALRPEFGDKVMLVCHDYLDIEFASAFPEAQLIYFDDVDRYIEALRLCQLNVSYRVHAFLPCFAFGTPTIHVSYDERGREMLATAGMAAWDINMLDTLDLVEAVLSRARSLDRFNALRDAARPLINTMHQVTIAALTAFSEEVTAYRARQKNGRIV